MRYVGIICTDLQDFHKTVDFRYGFYNLVQKGNIYECKGVIKIMPILTKEQYKCLKETAEIFYSEAVLDEMEKRIKFAVWGYDYGD